MSSDNKIKEKAILKIAEGREKSKAVWFMRQAGRYLPDYSLIRKERKFLDMMKDSDTIYNITKLPLKYFNTDGLVVFSDILIPATKLGYSVNYEEGISITKRQDDFDYYKPLGDAMKRIADSFRDKTIIGISPGPFTFLSYIFDNGERGYPKTKKNIVERSINIDFFIEGIMNYAKIQVESGADVIQVFESWIGNVSENFYEKYLEQIERDFISNLKELGKPVIFFSEGSSHLYEKLIDLEADVYSLDWRTGLSYIKKYSDCIVQGNLDPNLLSLDRKMLEKEVMRIMKEGSEMSGHIFNLGHGVPQWADPEALRFIVDLVNNYE